MILCKSFPREVAMPNRRECLTEKDFYDFVNKYNKIKKGIYFALYSGMPHGYSYKYDTATIDKIFFDFDTDGAFDDMCKLHSYCKKEHIRHTMVFSGGGYHFYIFCKNGKGLKNNKTALLGAHNHFTNMLELALDPHIKGDVARVSRVPNTWNGKRKRFCIPIDSEDLKLGDAHIREKAKKQNFKFQMYGKNLLDMQQFDNGLQADFIRMELDAEAKKVIVEDDLLKKLPLCVAHWLQKGDPGWRERFLLIVYFRDQGYLINETCAILKKFLSPKKYDHCIKSERQPQYLYSRPDLMFPLCERLEMEGHCFKGCKHRNKIYR